MRVFLFPLFLILGNFAVIAVVCECVCVWCVRFYLLLLASLAKQTCDSITTNCVFKVPPVLQNRSSLCAHGGRAVRNRRGEWERGGREGSSASWGAWLPAWVLCLWQCLLNMRVTLPAIKFKLHSLSTHCNTAEAAAAEAACNDDGGNGNGGGGTR